MNEENQETTQEEAAQEAGEIEVRRKKLDELYKSGRDPFQITTCPRDTMAQEIRDRFAELENKDVCIAGRVMSWRDMGKASFMDIYDRTGRIQVYMKIDQVGEDSYTELKTHWDVGDIISVKGYVFKTRRGEISVHAKEIRLLSKSLRQRPQ